MREVTVSEAEDDFGSLLRQVEKGETVVVSRDGRPIAQISPAAATRRDPAKIKSALEELERIRARTKPVSVEEVIAWRNEGRK